MRYLIKWYGLCQLVRVRFFTLCKSVTLSSGIWSDSTTWFGSMPVMNSISFYDSQTQDFISNVSDTLWFIPTNWPLQSAIECPLINNSYTSQFDRLYPIVKDTHGTVLWQATIKGVEGIIDIFLGNCFDPKILASGNQLILCSQLTVLFDRSVSQPTPMPVKFSLGPHDQELKNVNGTLLLLPRGISVEKSSFCVASQPAQVIFHAYIPREFIFDLSWGWDWQDLTFYGCNTTAGLGYCTSATGSILALEAGGYSSVLLRSSVLLCSSTSLSTCRQTVINMLLAVPNPTISTISTIHINNQQQTPLTIFGSDFITGLTVSIGDQTFSAITLSNFTWINDLQRFSQADLVIPAGSFSSLPAGSHDLQLGVKNNKDVDNTHCQSAQTITVIVQV